MANMKDCGTDGGKKPLLLMILDGYGINNRTEGNAIKGASKPNLDRLMREYPNTLIYTSGMNVGLPDGQMGNSEVGHTNIGAGRIVYQDLTRITKSIKDGDFFDNPAFRTVIDNCREKGTSLHLFGLLSDGGVHSHNTHLYALLKMAISRGLKDVYVHCFLDGRDVPPDSGKGYMEQLVREMSDMGVGRVASVMGRFYAMDRDNIWDRVKLAYNAMVKGEGLQEADPVEAVFSSYARKELDEFVKPTVITENGKPVGRIGADDSVIFFNFRADRAREITRAFVDEDFKAFDREGTYSHKTFVCMTQYDETIKNVHIAYYPQSLVNNFGEYISRLGYKQLRIAETQKYAHVTFFFNGGEETMYEGEDRILVPSPKIETFDLKPEMSAYEVTDKVVDKIHEGRHDVIILNYANPDMVGHTGIYNAAKAAIEAVDRCVGRVAEAVAGQGGTMIITADHGNAEQLIDYTTGGPFTAHTTNPVPFILVTGGSVCSCSSRGKEIRLKEKGRLADIAPTMLDLMGVAKPPEMTGESLVIR